MALLPGQIVGALAPIVGKAGAAGIAGNLMQESSDNPASAGGGLAQWQGSRYTGLLNYANSAHVPATSAQAALGYLTQDLKGPYAGLAAQLRSTADPAKAATLFSNIYERPGTPMLGNRINYAKQAFGSGGGSLGLPKVSSPASAGSAAPTSTTGFNTTAAEDAALMSTLNRPINMNGHVAAPNMLSNLVHELSNPAYVTHTAPSSVNPNTSLTSGVKPSAGLSDLHPHGGGYVNPVSGDTVRWERTDQGVDAALGVGQPIRAIGDAKVMGVEPNWYNGQPMLWYQLLSGPDAGKYVYVAEQITNLAKPGTIVKAGEPVANYASSGTGIETGWAVGSGATQARALGQVNDPTHANTQAGASFRALLNQLGAKAG